jgi:hypothetical protein
MMKRLRRKLDPKSLLNRVRKTLVETERLLELTYSLIEKSKRQLEQNRRSNCFGRGFTHIPVPPRQESRKARRAEHPDRYDGLRDPEFWLE